MSKITFVHAADWYAVYKDGKHIYEDDDMPSADEILTLLGIKIDYVEADSEWNEEQEDGYPENLEDVKKQ